MIEAIKQFGGGFAGVVLSFRSGGVHSAYNIEFIVNQLDLVLQKLDVGTVQEFIHVGIVALFEITAYCKADKHFLIDIVIAPASVNAVGTFNSGQRVGNLIRFPDGVKIVVVDVAGQTDQIGFLAVDERDAILNLREADAIAQMKVGNQKDL